MFEPIKVDRKYQFIKNGMYIFDETEWQNTNNLMEFIVFVKTVFTRMNTIETTYMNTQTDSKDSKYLTLLCCSSDIAALAGSSDTSNIFKDDVDELNALGGTIKGLEKSISVKCIIDREFVLGVFDNVCEGYSLQTEQHPLVNFYDITSKENQDAPPNFIAEEVQNVFHRWTH